MSGRITLTSSTKTSLHERLDLTKIYFIDTLILLSWFDDHYIFRFTKLAAVTRTTSKPASANARKTAQQVAMRPNVQAALKIKNVSFKIWILFSFEEI